MLKYIILSISLLLVNAKPILDEDLINPHYKKLADNVDSKLKFVQGIGKGKGRSNDLEEELLTTSVPTIQLPTTPLIDTNEEIDDESSNSEEENEHQPTEATNVTSSPGQILSVEEQENQTVFDDKQEILAKKTMPQIIRTANSLPTILPQTASASKPTPSKAPTTQIPSELTEYKQKSKLAENQKHQPKLSIDSQQLHNVEIMDDGREIAGNRQDFDSKNLESHQEGGSIIQNQLIPDLHEKLDPMTTISSFIVPQKALTTTENPQNDQESLLTKIIKGIRCSHGDCEGVLLSTTPSGPRELKPSKIIRRVRRQDGSVAAVCRCLTG